VHVVFSNVFVLFKFWSLNHRVRKFSFFFTFFPHVSSFLLLFSFFFPFYFFPLSFLFCCLALLHCSIALGLILLSRIVASAPCCALCCLELLSRCFVTSSCCLNLLPCHFIALHVASNYFKLPCYLYLEFPLSLSLLQATSSCKTTPVVAIASMSTIHYLSLPFATWLPSHFKYLLNPHLPPTPALAPAPPPPPVVSLFCYLIALCWLVLPSSFVGRSLDSV
jgi:hypothetical protein